MANDTAANSSPASNAKRTAGVAKPTKARRPGTTGARTRSATSATGTRAKSASAKASAGTKSRNTTKHTTGGRRNARGTTERVGDYAERAVLIPVGVALTARDRVVSGVSDVISSYSSPAKAEAQLRKFERRGNTARNRLEREVRKTRTRLERELRERRRELERRREGVTKSLTTQVEQTQAQIEKTQSQIESTVRTRLEDGADLANRLQERVLNLV